MYRFVKAWVFMVAWVLVQEPSDTCILRTHACPHTRACAHTHTCAQDHLLINSYRPISRQMKSIKKHARTPTCTDANTASDDGDDGSDDDDGDDGDDSTI